MNFGISSSHRPSFCSILRSLQLHSPPPSLSRLVANSSKRSFINRRGTGSQAPHSLNGFLTATAKGHATDLKTLGLSKISKQPWVQWRSNRTHIEIVVWHDLYVSESTQQGAPACDVIPTFFICNLYLVPVTQRGAHFLHILCEHIS